VLYCPADADRELPEFRLLAVHPEQRDRGLGAVLIEHCEQLARDEGFPGITLHTTVLMQTAKAMYERRGYVAAPELDFWPSPDFVVWGFRKTFEKPQGL
jgi:GNAT superfamily N-acetyltransferase